MTFWNGFAAASMMTLGTSLNIASGKPIFAGVNNGGAGGGLGASVGGAAVPAATIKDSPSISPHTRTTSHPFAL